MHRLVLLLTATSLFTSTSEAKLEYGDVEQCQVDIKDDYTSMMQAKLVLNRGQGHASATAQPRVHLVGGHSGVEVQASLAHQSLVGVTAVVTDAKVVPKEVEEVRSQITPIEAFANGARRMWLRIKNGVARMWTKLKGGSTFLPWLIALLVIGVVLCCVLHFQYVSSSATSLRGGQQRFQTTRWTQDVHRTSLQERIILPAGARLPAGTIPSQPPSLPVMSLRGSPDRRLGYPRHWPPEEVAQGSSSFDIANLSRDQAPAVCCFCGCRFLDDAITCRKCGKSRTATAEIMQTQSHSAKIFNALVEVERATIADVDSAPLGFADFTLADGRALNRMLMHLPQLQLWNIGDLCSPFQIDLRPLFDSRNRFADNEVQVLMTRLGRPQRSAITCGVSCGQPREDSQVLVIKSGGNVVVTCGPPEQAAGNKRVMQIRGFDAKQWGVLRSYGRDCDNVYWYTAESNPDFASGDSASGGHRRPLIHIGHIDDNKERETFKVCASEGGNPPRQARAEELKLAEAASAGDAFEIYLGPCFEEAGLTSLQKVSLKVLMLSLVLSVKVFTEMKAGIADRRAF